MNRHLPTHRIRIIQVHGTKIKNFHWASKYVHERGVYECVIPIKAGRSRSDYNTAKKIKFPIAKNPVKFFLQRNTRNHLWNHF